MSRQSFVKNCCDVIFEMAISNSIKAPYYTIELFTGTGEIYTSEIARHCNSLIGFDINSEKKKEFYQNIPNGNFICEDVIQRLKYGNFSDLLANINIISIDNPLGFYGSSNEYCEHFSFIDDIHKLVSNKVILAFNIVKQPYSYEKNSEWNKERQRFYKREFNVLDMAETEQFYINRLKLQGLNILDSKMVCREYDNDLDYFYMFIACVEKVNK